MNVIKQFKLTVIKHISFENYEKLRHAIKKDTKRENKCLLV